MSEEKKAYTFVEYVLFKLDRNIAIVGLVSIGVLALIIKHPAAEKIASGVIGALAVYLGARGTSGAPDKKPPIG